MTLTVVTCCWRGSRGDLYQPWHVENLRHMLAKHLTVPHRFVCVTDLPAEDFPGIETVPMWERPDIEPEDREARIGTKGHWLDNYRRLGLCGEHGARIGSRIWWFDLDVTIRKNINDLLPPEGTALQTLDFGRGWLSAGMVYVEPPIEPCPWRACSDPELVARSRRFPGSDQAVLTELYNGKVPTWGPADGVQVNRYNEHGWRVLFRTGNRKPWDRRRQEQAVYLRESGRAA